MNKLLLALLISGSTLCHTVKNLIDATMRNTLITAIARNDLGTVTKTLESLPIMTQKENDEFLEMADQMIIAAIEWQVSHHWHPEFGKDSCKTLGYYFATLISGVATGISGGLVYHTIQAHIKPHKYNKLDLPPLEYTSVCAALLAGITAYLGYKTIQKGIAAWEKPSQRLENALRIKDAILHYPLVSPLSHHRDEEVEAFLSPYNVIIENENYESAAYLKQVDASEN